MSDKSLYQSSPSPTGLGTVLSMHIWCDLNQAPENLVHGRGEPLADGDPETLEPGHVPGELGPRTSGGRPDSGPRTSCCSAEVSLTSSVTNTSGRRFQSKSFFLTPGS